MPAPLSIYNNVFKVLPGYYVKFDLKNEHLADPICYWDHRVIAERGQQHQFCGSKQATESELENLLKSAVKLRMIADVPLGAFLSGGIDSSLVVALMQAQSHQPVKTFTIGFEEAHFNEANEAKLVAAHLATEHT